MAEIAKFNPEIEPSQFWNSGLSDLTEGWHTGNGAEGRGAWGTSFRRSHGHFRLWVNEYEMRDSQISFVAVHSKSIDYGSVGDVQILAGISPSFDLPQGVDFRMTNIDWMLPAADRSADESMETLRDPVVSALNWIKDHTDLSWNKIAQLFGVQRQTLNNWRSGSPIRSENRRRLLAVADVLTRANQRYLTKEGLTTWLDTPRGVESKTPATWLAEGNIDRARLLAITEPSRNVRSFGLAKAGSRVAPDLPFGAVPPEDRELEEEMTNEFLKDLDDGDEA